MTINSQDLQEPLSIWLDTPYWYTINARNIQAFNKAVHSLFQKYPAGEVDATTFAYAVDEYENKSTPTDISEEDLDKRLSYFRSVFEAISQFIADNKVDIKIEATPSNGGLNNE